MDERNDVVEELRATMLRAVVLSQPLPGSERPVSFPDLAFITESPNLLIASDNLSGQFEPGDVGKPVDILDAPDLRARAEREGDLPYVFFQPAEWQGDNVRIALEVRIAPTQPDLLPLGLGGISATFEEINGNWTIVDGPSVMAI